MFVASVVVALVVLAAGASNAHATTASDLSTISGDGTSIGEWYNGSYVAGGGACDALCTGIGNALVTNPQAASEGVGLFDAVDGGLEGGAIGGLPGVAAGAAAGALTWLIGSLLNGSSGPTPSAQPTGKVYMVQMGACSGSAVGCSTLNATTCGSSLFTFGTGRYYGNTYSGSTVACDTLQAGYVGSYLDYGNSVTHGTSGGTGTITVNRTQFTSKDWVIAPYGFTVKNPSGGAWTGTPTVTTTSPASATGSGILSTLNSNPSQYQHLIHQIYLAHVAAYVTVPNCFNVSLSSCSSMMSTAGLTLGTAVTGTSPVSGVSHGNVASTTPASGATVLSGGSVVPTVEPWIIPAPTPNELITQYVTDLGTAGFSNVITTTLTDATLDPTYGPNEVVRVSPLPATLEPNGTVAVYPVANPATAPYPPGDPNGTPSATGALPTSAPTVPGLPGIAIPTASTPCNVFPFGIPCWLSSQLGSLSATPIAPSFSVSVPTQLGGGSHPLSIDLSSPFGADMNGFMGVFRTILLFASFIGIVLWLGGMAMGGSTGGGGGSESEE